MRENVWNRQANTDQAEIVIRTGTYIFSFNTKYVPNSLLPKEVAQRELTITGKRIRLDSWAIMEEGDRCELTLTVIENPLPLLAIVIGVGVIGITAAMLLDSVDKVSEDVKETVKSPGFLLVALGIFAFIVAPYVRPYLRGGS